MFWICSGERDCTSNSQGVSRVRMAVYLAATNDVGASSGYGDEGGSEGCWK